MTDTLLGHAWGWGALAIVPMEPGWLCPHCGKKAQWALDFGDGRMICGPCAQARYLTPSVAIVPSAGKFYPHCSACGPVGRGNTTVSYAEERGRLHVEEVHG